LPATEPAKPPHWLHRSGDFENADPPACGLNGVA
jgi:hypothetical protein